MSKRPTATIVPVNSGEVIARILDLAERLDRKRDQCPKDSIPWHRADEGAKAVRTVATMLATVLTAAHTAATPPGERH